MSEGFELWPVRFAPSSLEDTLTSDSLRISESLEILLREKVADASAGPGDPSAEATGFGVFQASPAALEAAGRIFRFAESFRFAAFLGSV